MDGLIYVENLAKRYYGFSLENIGFAVPAGTVVGLIGSNGAGKTTTLKAILGMIDTDAGSAVLLGHKCTSSDTSMDAIKQRIGVVFDTCAFPIAMNVKDVGTLGSATYENWDSVLFRSLCKRFELPEKKSVQKLSRGMGMKLTLAFAFAHRPELLILDEATAGLDPIARDEILDLIRQFMEDPTHAVLMSTHITTDLEKIADEVICIDEGRMVFDLPKEAICDEAGIAHCRASELEKLFSDGILDMDALYVTSKGYGTDVLVSDRFAFAKLYPDVAVDRASIEDYMTLVLKGKKGGMQ